MENVVFLANEINDNTMLTPKQILQIAIDDIDAGRIDINKMLILTLKQGDGFYDNGFYACNMSASEKILLCERAKHEFHKQMDGD